MSVQDLYLPALVSETLLHELHGNATMARVCAQAIEALVGTEGCELMLNRERVRQPTPLILELPYVDSTAPISCRRLPLEMALLEHAEREAS